MDVEPLPLYSLKSCFLSVTTAYTDDVNQGGYSKL